MAEETESHREPPRPRDSRSRSRSPPHHRSQSHRTRSPLPQHSRSHTPHSHHPSRSHTPHDPSHLHHHTHPHHAHLHKDKTQTQTPIELPFGSRQLTKRDFEAFKPMFALYLDIQKGKVLEDLEGREQKGRWKSFVGKWNRGELAEGWYDPGTLGKAVDTEKKSGGVIGRGGKREEDDEGRREDAGRGRMEGREKKGEESDSDESIGPALPGQEGRGRGRMGPSIPNMQDLELKREMEAEDGLARRDDIRFARKLDRKEQKAALDELVPRAEAGTRERQLEKKKELNEKLKSFREKSPGAAEVPDSELMGGGDGLEEFKKTKKEFERKKNERELRKEEILRARMAEREERLQEYRVKEEGTMSMLKALAKQRFG